MVTYGFSLLAAPLAWRFTLDLDSTEGAASLLNSVAVLNPWHRGVSSAAAILSSECYASCLQTLRQGLLLFHFEVGLNVLLTAAALAAILLLFWAHRRAVSALRESENRYCLLFESSPYPAWVFDRETLSFLAVNAAAVRRYGYTREEFLGMTIKDIRPPEEVPKLLRRIAQEEGRTTADGVWRHRTKGGAVIYVEITSAELNFRGRRAVLILAYDVTERIRAEEALRHAEEKYRGIFENAVEGIFQSTPDGRFISVNPAMARMFGFDSPEQMIAERTDIERQHYVDPLRRAEMKRIIEERSVVLDFVAEAYRRDGSMIWTASNTRAVRGADGAICYYEGFLQEVTDRVRADEWERRQKRLSALRADVVAALGWGGVSLRAILQQTAEAMVRHLDVALARIWTLNQDRDVLELQASAGLYTNLDDKFARIPVGCHMVGSIARERVPHLTNEVQQDARTADPEWARRERLVSFAGYPLLVEGRLVGVMAMFARRALQQDTLDALSSVADTIAQGVERVRAEAALRDSEQRFRRLIEEVHVGILLVGAEAEIFLSNGAARRMLGMSEDQLTRKTPFDPCWEIIKDDGTPFPPDALPIPRAIVGRSPVRNVVMGVYRPATRDRVWLLVDAEPHLGDDGGVTHVVCTFSDITERKRAEESLRQSEERNRAILKATPDLMFLLTRDGVYLDYHTKDTADLLAPPESFLGKNMREVLPPELAEEFTCCFERAAQTGATQVCEYVLTVGGQQRHYEARVVSCDGDRILAVARDVTAHRQAEAQRTQLLGRLVSAQEEERARLAREVHDEFAAYLSALKWGIESSKRVEGLPARAESELSYLVGLTTQLQHKVRDFAFELSPAELDDREGLPAALDRYVKRLAERSDGRLEAEFCRAGFNVGSRLPREVEIALYRVAQEALTNVLKHAEAQRVTVTLESHAPDEAREEVRLRVEDDGVGFAPAHSEGSERGLGLKGMGERMALLGGTLEIKSGKEGTTLLVKVPVSATRHGGRNGGAANTHC